MTSRATQYTTIAAPVDVEWEIKRSVFLARMRRVESEDQARAFVAACRKEHHDARHHCSAFVLRADRDVQRSSDDGEPAGTAGIPMLEALTHAEIGGRRDLSDVVVVVTRWFGGIKLGAGGLVRAYSDSVSRAVGAASPLLRERRRLLSVAVGFDEVGKLEQALRHAGEIVLPTAYGATSATLNLAVVDGPTALEDAAARLNMALARDVEIVAGEREWIDRTEVPG